MTRTKEWRGTLPTYALVVGMVAGLALMALPAAAEGEWRTYESKKYGFSMMIPPEFKLQSEDKGATWIYQPGSLKEEGGVKKEKKKKLSVSIKGIGLSTEDSDKSSSSSSGGGGLESALTVYVNWTWMPDVDSGTLYKVNKEQDEKNIKSPDPGYTDLKVFSKKDGYASEGNTYWIKETKKSDMSEIHRWHIKSFGNKSSYTVGLCGTYQQVDEWAPIYEKIIKSWKLIPMEK